MGRIILISCILLCLKFDHILGQCIKEKDVPSTVYMAFENKFRRFNGVSWEMERKMYSANWGGIYGLDTSAVFTASGTLFCYKTTIDLTELPDTISPYIYKMYGNVCFLNAMKVTDSLGRLLFEIKIRNKDLIFNNRGLFLKEE